MIIKEQIWLDFNIILILTSVKMDTLLLRTRVPMWVAYAKAYAEQHSGARTLALARFSSPNLSLTVCSTWEDKEGGPQLWKFKFNSANIWGASGTGC